MPNGRWDQAESDDFRVHKSLKNKTRAQDCELRKSIDKLNREKRSFLSKFNDQKAKVFRKFNQIKTDRYTANQRLREALENELVHERDVSDCRSTNCSRSQTLGAPPSVSGGVIGGGIDMVEDQQAQVADWIRHNGGGRISGEQPTARSGITSPGGGADFYLSTAAIGVLVPPGEGSTLRSRSSTAGAGDLGLLSCDWEQGSYNNITADGAGSVHQVEDGAVQPADFGNNESTRRRHYKRPLSSPAIRVHSDSDNNRELVGATAEPSDGDNDKDYGVFLTSRTPPPTRSAWGVHNNRAYGSYLSVLGDEDSGCNNRLARSLNSLQDLPQSPGEYSPGAYSPRATSPGVSPRRANSPGLNRQRARSPGAFVTQKYRAAAHYDSSDDDISLISLTGTPPKSPHLLTAPPSVSVSGTRRSPSPGRRLVPSPTSGGHTGSGLTLPELADDGGRRSPNLVAMSGGSMSPTQATYSNYNSGNNLSKSMPAVELSPRPAQRRLNQQQSLTMEPALLVGPTAPGGPGDNRGKPGLCVVSSVNDANQGLGTTLGMGTNSGSSTASVRAKRVDTLTSSGSHTQERLSVIAASSDIDINRNGKGSGLNSASTAIGSVSAKTKATSTAPRQGVTSDSANSSVDVVSYSGTTQQDISNTNSRGIAGPGASGLTGTGNTSNFTSPLVASALRSASTNPGGAVHSGGSTTSGSTSIGGNGPNGGSTKTKKTAPPSSLTLSPATINRSNAIKPGVNSPKLAVGTTSPGTAGSSRRNSHDASPTGSGSSITGSVSAGVDAASLERRISLAMAKALSVDNKAGVTSKRTPEELDFYRRALSGSKLPVSPNDILRRRSATYSSGDAADLKKKARAAAAKAERAKAAEAAEQEIILQNLNQHGLPTTPRIVLPTATTTTATNPEIAATTTGSTEPLHTASRSHTRLLNRQKDSLSGRLLPKPELALSPKSQPEMGEEVEVCNLGEDWQLQAMPFRRRSVTFGGQSSRPACRLPGIIEGSPTPETAASEGCNSKKAPLLPKGHGVFHVYSV